MRDREIAFRMALGQFSPKEKEKTNMDNIFDKELLKEWLEYVPKKVTYVMGFDSYGREEAYCLMKEVDGVSSVVLSKDAMVKDKTDSEKSELEIEMENIAKYFDAKIYREI